MTPEERLLDMEEAALEAIAFLDGISFEAFESDLLRQRAVAMTFVLVATAAARIQALFPDCLRAAGDLLDPDQGPAQSCG